VNAYCSIDDLAAALRIAVSPANTDMLTRCCEAAALEIDHTVDSPDPPDYSEPWNPLWTAVNIPRAVEWFKASDAAFGVIGYDQTGAIRTPRNGFQRYALALIVSKQQFGVA
jgi:hypothetical protein